MVIYRLNDRPYEFGTFELHSFPQVLQILAMEPLTSPSQTEGTLLDPPGQRTATRAKTIESVTQNY